MYVGGQTYCQSLDSGASWAINPPPYIPAGSLACSASGAEIIPTEWTYYYEYGGMSPDYGAHWYFPNTAQSGVTGDIYCTPDGGKLALVNGTIYIAQSVSFVPALSVTLATNSAILSWLIPAAPFTLQQSADLETWSIVTNAPVLNFTNLQNQVTLPISQSQTFYRLKTP